MKRETHPSCAFSFVARTDLRPRLRGPRARAPAGRDVSASRPQSSPLPAPSLLIQTTIRRVHVGVTASYLRSIRFVRHRSRSTIQCRRTVLATPVTRRLLGFQKNPSKFKKGQTAVQILNFLLRVLPFQVYMMIVLLRLYASKCAHAGVSVSSSDRPPVGLT